MNLSEDRRVVAGTNTGPSLPVNTPSKAEEFPQSSSLREGIPSNSTNSREARLDKKLHHDMFTFILFCHCTKKLCPPLQIKKR